MPKHGLAEYVAARLDIPFKWGSNDCIHFTMGWMSIVMDAHLLADYEPWRNKREAHKRMKEHGGLVHIFNILFDSINPNMAVDGDVTVIGTTSYLFVGRHIASPGDDGLVFQNRMKATCAWRYKR
jgi:hypothetical protein